MKPIRVMIMAAGLSWPGVVTAADDATPLLDAPEITIEADSSAPGGWYLRGDAGYGLWKSAGSPDLAAEAGEAKRFDDSRFGRPLSGSVGFGYRINDIIRTDVTGEFFTEDMAAEFTAGQPCATSSPAGTSCAYDGAADVHAYGLMLNGYVDLANVAGFTPYLGAGVGVTRVVWDDFAADSICAGSACGATGSNPASFDGESSWRFSYALMAGVSYELSERVKLDLGYRYSDIAGGPMFRSAAGRADDDGFRRHEIRVGLRVGF